MNKKYFQAGRLLIVLSLLLRIARVSGQAGEFPTWTHFYIDAILPGSTYGMAGPALGDFDKDGDLDVAVSRWPTREAYWYERINDSIWVPHSIGISDILGKALGSVAIDMDNDGWQDVVFDDIWFKNPGTLDEEADAEWKSGHIQGGGHDIIRYDINGDGKEDLVIFDGQRLSWNSTSIEMQTDNIVADGFTDHGGIAPHGAGDLDGDGDPDLVIPGYWFENPGKGAGKWQQHEWPFQPVPGASYGNSIRSWITDINHDGINDIVYSNCDTGGSHVYWVENKGNGRGWISHKLPDPPVKNGDVPGTGSFHSLGVADFDMDGNPDIFAGEQEDPDDFMVQEGKVAMKPAGLNERGAIWFNKGGKSPEFNIFIIHTGNPGWHDAQLGDVDGDGDIDIISKVWNADKDKLYHLDLWRNNLDPGKQGKKPGSDK